MRAVVFANGERPAPETVAQLLDGVQLVVAADGGADAALDLGLSLDLVIGDLDSISERARRVLPREALVADRDPNRTDLQKAIEECLARGATAVDVLGAGGGRADHALANLSVLFLYRERARIRFVEDLFEIAAVAGSAEVEGAVGTVVSLVAIGECRGVTTAGLRWNLRDATLRFSPVGVHNELASSPATISVASGDLLVFKGRWVERHQ